MVVHISLRAKASTALRTDKWTLVVVDSHVDFQVLLFRKSLGAIRKLAHERLCTIVDVHVRLEAHGAFEDLVAAREIAWKFLVFSNFIIFRTFSR